MNGETSDFKKPYDSSDPKKVKVVSVKMSLSEFSILYRKSKRYARSNLSEFLRRAALEWTPEIKK